LIEPYRTPKTKSVKTGGLKDYIRLPTTGSTAAARTSMPGATSGPSFRLWILAACGVATFFFFIQQIDHVGAYGARVPAMGIAMYSSAEWQAAFQQSLNAVKHPFRASTSHSSTQYVTDKYR
jgi:hypothetical protein